MAETLAASSPVEAPDPFNGQSPSLAEFNAYRQSGDIPERFKPEAESATADAPEETAEIAPETQELPPKTSEAEKRIKQLLGEVKALKEAQAKQTVPPPAIPPTRPEPTLNDKNDDGTLKYGDYQTFVKDLGKWSVEQSIHETRQRDQQQQQTQRITENIERDRRRYGEEFENVIEPTAGAINSSKSIPFEVKKMIAESDVLPDLIYTLGTDQKAMQELERLASTDPNKANRYIATLEVGIRQELAAEPDEETAPEPKKTTAPKPPVPVSGPTSRAFDVSDESLSNEEWARKRNAQIARRGRL